MANRLSKNQQWKILLIEAGDDGNYISDVPALQTKLYDTRFDWNFTTVKQNACLSTRLFFNWKYERGGETEEGEKAQ